MEVFSILQLTFSLISLVLSILLALPSSQLIFLEVQLISKVLTELSFLASSHFFSFQSLKNGVTCRFSLILCRLNLIQTLLLLLSILTNHLILISLHFLLTTNECTFLINRQNHISLRLLHFEVLDAGHFAIFRNHSLDNSVDLVAFFQILRSSFGLHLFSRFDLFLNGIFVLETVLETSSFRFTLDLVLDLFGSQHNFVDLSVLFLKSE